MFVPHRFFVDRLFSIFCVCVCCIWHGTRRASFRNTELEAWFLSYIYNHTQTFLSAQRKKKKNTHKKHLFKKCGWWWRRQKKVIIINVFFSSKRKYPFSVRFFVTNTFFCQGLYSISFFIVISFCSCWFCVTFFFLLSVHFDITKNQCCHGADSNLI